MSKSDDKGKSSIVREQGLTYEDYASLDDGNRYELVAGRLELMSPGPSVVHQMASGKLQFMPNTKFPSTGLSTMNRVCWNNICLMTQDMSWLISIKTTSGFNQEIYHVSLLR